MTSSCVRLTSLLFTCPYRRTLVESVRRLRLEFIALGFPYTRDQTRDNLHRNVFIRALRLASRVPVLNTPEQEGEGMQLVYGIIHIRKQKILNLVQHILSVWRVYEPTLLCA